MLTALFTRASTSASDDSPNSLADQIIRFIKTGVGTLGEGRIRSKEYFITQMAEFILASRQTTTASDKVQAAARKTSEVIYDELEHMAQRASVDNKTFMQSVNDSAWAAKAFFTDLIFGENKAATRSTIQDVLRGNTNPEPTPASVNQSGDLQQRSSSGASEKREPFYRGG